MATVSEERLAEMLADVEMTINASSLAGGAAYDIYPIEFQRALTELQSLRNQAGVSEAVAWGVWLNDGRADLRVGFWGEWSEIDEADPANKALKDQFRAYARAALQGETK